MSGSARLGKFSAPSGGYFSGRPRRKRIRDGARSDSGSGGSTWRARGVQGKNLVWSGGMMAGIRNCEARLHPINSKSSAVETPAVGRKPKLPYSSDAGLDRSSLTHTCASESSRALARNSRRPGATQRSGNWKSDHRPKGQPITQGS